MPSRRAVVVALAFLFVVPSAALAQIGLMANGVVVTPDGTPITVVTSSAYQATFQVWNSGSTADGYDLICTDSGPVTCGTISVNGVPQDWVSLSAGQSRTVRVDYTTGGTTGAGTLLLAAIGEDSENEGGYNVSVAGPPTLTLVVPASGATAVVRSRQPIVRAQFLPNFAAIDTAATRLVWQRRGTTADTVTLLARHNRGLLEWEVDSTHWLRTGLAGFSGADTAQLVVKVCGTMGGCTTTTQAVILPNDSTPVLGFTGMPLGTANGGFSAPFGPGLSVTGAEIETGFSTTAYYSMGAARSAGLVYSTRQSYPRALVHVDLDLPWPTTSASSVKLVLLDGIVRLDSLVLASPATACLTGTIRRCRATLQGEFTSGGSTPAITRKWLKVEATVTSGVTSKMSLDSVEVVLVDRRGSRYGSGWWPSALSQMVQAGNDRILVGPTGTATIYRGNGDSVYLPPPGNFTGVTVESGYRVLRPRGSLAKVTFYSDGRVYHATDVSGNVNKVRYAGATDQIDSLVDPLGKRLIFGYASGKLATITDPGGRQSTVTIDGSNRLTRRWLVSPAGRPDTVGYAYQTYPGTNTAVLLRRHGVLGDTTRVVYDSTFRRRPVEVRLPRVAIATDADTTPIVRYTASERQGIGALRSLDSVYVEMQDPRGHWTRSLLNRWAQSRKSWDALGLLSKATYDPDGFLLSAEGKNGDSSRVYSAYDAERRLVKTWIERGAATGAHVLRTDSLVYDANHRVTRRIDARGQATEYTYDGLGRTIKVRTPNGVAWDSVVTWYRSDGLVDSTKQSGYTGRATRYTYESNKQVLRVLANTGDTLSTAAYDSDGRLVSSVRRDRVGLVGTTLQYQWTIQETFYDVANLVDSARTMLSPIIDEPAGGESFDPSDTLRSQRVGYRYDRAGRDTARVNNRGKATTYRLDRLGRVVARRPWADSTAVKDSTVYDIAGNVHKVVTRRGTTITYTTDSRGRNTVTAVPGVGTYNRTFGGPQDQLTRLWLTSAIDSIGTVNGEVRSGYDSRGRLRADTAYTGNTPRVTTFSYDTYERPLTTTDAIGAWSVRYETVRGLPDTLLTPLGDTVVTVINSRGQMTSRSIVSTGQKLSQSFLYKRNASASQSTSTPTGVAGGYTAGEFERVTGDTGWIALSPTWTQRLGAGGAEQVLQDSTAYDAWGRLTRWNGMKDGSSVTSEDYTFDRTGNIKQPTGAANYHAMTDQLRGRANGAGRDSLRYDHAGNLIQLREASGGPIWDYGYDALERLVSVRRNSTLIARYGYDVLGRRIVKRVYSSASGGTVGFIRFAYRGGQVGFETDSGGTTIGLRYTYGGTDQLLAITDGATHYYVTTDKLGSVRSLAKRDGTWALTQRFHPYGARIARDTSASYGLGVRLRYGWTGREYDAETGFSFHRARYYLPTTRRWIQEDPIGYAGGGNLYAYVGGAPLEARDPSGLIAATRDDPQGWTFCTMAGNCASPFGNMIGRDESISYNLFSGGGGSRRGGGLVATVRNPDGTTSEVSCRSMQNACRQWLNDRGGARSLTHSERDQLGNFCQHVECGRVRIFENVEGSRGVTLGHDIYLPKDIYSLDNLAHEMTHVAQFEDWGAVQYYARGVWEQVRHRAHTWLGIGSNPYTLPDPLPGNRPYGRYGMEQQAMITERCFGGGQASSNACGISPYHP